MSLILEFRKHSQEQIVWMALRKHYEQEINENKQETTPPEKQAQGSAFQEDNNDKLIALAAKRALRRNIDICLKDIRVTVNNGWITLSGRLNWNYQRESAGNCLNIKGIKGIINNITITSAKNMMLAFMAENPAIQ